MRNLALQLVVMAALLGCVSQPAHPPVPANASTSPSSKSATLKAKVQKMKAGVRRLRPAPTRLAIVPTVETNRLMFDNESGGWVNWWLEYSNVLPPRWNYYASGASSNQTIEVRAPVTNQAQFYRVSFIH